MRFEEAQKMIEKRTGLANSMHPSNAPYFSVFATDFTVPEHAKMILEKYGEDRGDGKRLYRFPIVFQTSDIDRIMPGGFRRSKGEPEYFSTQGQDGVRYCTYYEHVTPEQIQAQRRQRVIQVRPEPKIRGQCDPGKCTEFADGSCRFVGELSFYIPGIPAGGLMKLTTGSEYACEEMYMELARIKEALVEGFAEVLGVRFAPGPLTPLEEELLSQRLPAFHMQLAANTWQHSHHPQWRLRSSCG